MQSGVASRTGVRRSFSRKRGLIHTQTKLTPKEYDVLLLQYINFAQQSLVGHLIVLEYKYTVNTDWVDE
jgi:hypothetical protein